VTTGILLLAAGRARRFGTDKRLALLPHGHSVIHATIANVRASGLPFLVCLGARDTELIRRLQREGYRCQPCMRAGEGMGATLAEGVGHIPGWDGVLVALADMPWIAPVSYGLVAERLSVDSIVVPVHRGRRGHPVGFGRHFFPELVALRGDVGARPLLDAHTNRITELPLADPAINRDIDVPSDLLTG